MGAYIAKPRFYQTCHGAYSCRLATIDNIYINVHTVVQTNDVVNIQTKLVFTFRELSQTNHKVIMIGWLVELSNLRPIDPYVPNTKPSISRIY